MFPEFLEAFHHVHPNKEVPSKTTIFRLVEKFRETGSVCDRKHVRPVIVLTHDMVCIVQE
jgi:hypothetical protein